MTIETYIEKFREEYGVYPWKNWFCYNFARVLQVNFGGVVYATEDHCMLCKDNYLYDIDWRHEMIEDYDVIDEFSENRYKSYDTYQISTCLKDTNTEQWKQK